ncbi:MAG: hypothetical protein AB7S87_11570 [Burkholderiales bacterium]
MKRATTIAAAVLLAQLATAQAAEEWRFGLNAEVVRDDNATRGLYDGRKSDSIAVIEGSATRSWLLSPRSGLLLRGAARYSHFMDIDDISNLALIGRAAWRIQPSLGYSAPWYELAGQAQVLRHADSELRDGEIFTFEASAGSHVTDRVRLAAGFGVDERSGGGTAGLYDLSTTRIFATADWRVGVRNALYLRATHQTGDHVFSSGSTSGLSSVWEDDPALRAPLGLAVANSYRLDATSLIFEVGFNYALRAEQALDFSVARYSTEVDEGPAAGSKYTSTQVRATWLYRFQ